MKTDLFIGLMCGTSMDAVDAVLVDFATAPIGLKHSLSLPVPANLKRDAMDFCTLPGRIEDAAPLHQAYARLFSQASLALLEQAKLKASEIRAIGCHGQTLLHQPQAQHPFSLQACDPHILARATGIPTVCDFRNPDMAEGGQGAPLAPAFHAHFFRSDCIDRIILNIGGIANITWLPADPQAPVLGFDTGPGNGLMDAWCARYENKPYDDRGQWASTGQLNTLLLEALLADPYFKRPPPKSTGKDYFNLAWIDKLLISLNLLVPAWDVQRTLLQLTAESICQGILSLSRRAQVLVCGGGVHNTLLMDILAQNLGESFDIGSSEACGLHPNWVEAVCFAWLARERLAGRPANLPSVTGARRAVLLGQITPP